MYNTNYIPLALYGVIMALDPKQLAELLKMRALGFSQAEIADALEHFSTSHRVSAKEIERSSEEQRN